MPKFDITATKVTNFTATIEASSEEEAQAIADEMSISEFFNCGGEFTIDYIEENTNA
jgi:hypothetical protein